LFNEKNAAEFWQSFANIIFNILFVIRQDFVILWQNTPCPVCHPVAACLVLTALVSLNSVARWCNKAQFLQKWCNL